jgi:uncharacterized protein YjiK
VQVAVYKNLNRGCWSIAEATATGNRGKLIRHAESLVLANAQFIVKESARNRVCRTKSREVHAWIIGEIVESVPSGDGIEVTYNPYRAPLFHRRDNGAAVLTAARVHFTESVGAMAYGDIS